MNKRILVGRPITVETWQRNQNESARETNVEI
mgnify:FL=1